MLTAVKIGKSKSQTYPVYFLAVNFSFGTISVKGELLNGSHKMA